MIQTIDGKCQVLLIYRNIERNVEIDFTIKFLAKWFSYRNIEKNPTQRKTFKLVTVRGKVLSLIYFNARRRPATTSTTAAATTAAATTAAAATTNFKCEPVNKRDKL